MGGFCHDIAGNGHASSAGSLLDIGICLRVRGIHDSCRRNCWALVISERFKTMGDEADADWQEGLVEWGIEDNEPEDPRRDCPWKCRLGDPKCLCARAGQGALKP